MKNKKLKNLLILLSFLFLSSPLFGQSVKPQTIIIPTGSLGEMSKIRIKILEKTLESKLDDYFAIVPKEIFEEAKEEAFQELEDDECTEDQCVMKIQEILQVENAFKMELIFEDGNTQISITWNNQEEKRVAEDYCEGCKTKKLRETIGRLVEELLGKKNSTKEDERIAAEKRRIEDQKEADLKNEKQKMEEEKRQLAAERRRIEAEKTKNKTKIAPKTRDYGISSPERMRVRFDSSLVGSHEAEFSPWENTPKTLNLMTISMIFKNNFGVGISTIDWAGTTSGGSSWQDYQNWGVSGNFLNGYYVFEETNPNTYWIDDMPLSLTLGTSYPLSLEMKWGMGYKDDASLFSQLISIGVKVTDDFELILNGRYYGFTEQNGERFNLTAYTLGIGYLF
jgi:hypothetical protein